MLHTKWLYSPDWVPRTHSWSYPESFITTPPPPQILWGSSKGITGTRVWRLWSRLLGVHRVDSSFVRSVCQHCVYAAGYLVKRWEGGKEGQFYVAHNQPWLCWVEGWLKVWTQSLESCLWNCVTVWSLLPSAPGSRMVNEASQFPPKGIVQIRLTIRIWCVTVHVAWAILNLQKSCQPKWCFI